MQSQYEKQKKKTKEAESNENGNLHPSELKIKGDETKEFTLTRSEEDYLKTIEELSSVSEISVSEVAAQMGHKAPSVSEMVTRLSKKGLVDHEKYGHLSLTERGKKIAQRVKTKHNILSKFLELFGVKKKHADADACQMEHFIHDETIKRLEKFVEFVEKSPTEPLWLDHFKNYLDTGAHSKCRNRSSKKCI